MSRETVAVVRLPEAVGREVSRLERLAAEALRRSTKLPPGDRTEILRFDALMTAVERVALTSLWAGEPHIVDPGPADTRLIDEWRAADWVVVELRLPHGKGETLLEGEAGRGPPLPAERWRSEGGPTTEVVRARFRSLIEAALTAGTPEKAVIRPDGVSNSVLTETLREFVHCGNETSPVELPVRYLDGSPGPAFPLRALQLSDQTPDYRRVLSFTLLSIRHVDMDHLVDGAWLRNARISQPRPAGLTDELVYETSLRQLEALSGGGPTVIRMYQTGLATAVVGFYRAVTRHLMRYPGSVAVVPLYYRGGAYEEGTAWTTA
ncbi:MAG: hypothetical protein QME55_00045 [Brevundimonas sp.]|uniref:hypothetical protein n=1 Tax=Brevundimonas sp. TaxID=1871086 RepID=UPI002620B69B|nr:hypothetical protein [Brevundimonas sp.]MDI6623093.1 hypothetical protein [Brevundimonas sp.]MDQ7812812.1 hypothetical protein [Brevundimonas sp.]